ncbi:autotransporter outer membrane beta-barrel domain-containing protein [Ereboglobus luteus]|nr:autotransporter outer membrane beta-barrel domain-containing protein [Ereboglobus luteus]
MKTHDNNMPVGADLRGFRIFRAAAAFAGGMALMAALHAQIPPPNQYGGNLRDPNKPYYSDGTTRLFIEARWTGATTNLLDPAAWSTGTVPNDPEGARTYGTGYSGTGYYVSGTLMGPPPPDSPDFIPGTVLVLPYKTTSGGYAIPDTVDPTKVEWYGGNKYEPVHLQLAWTGSGDFYQNIDHIQYVDGYALDLSGNDSGRYTLDINGMGIVRWNTDNDGTSSTAPEFTGSSNPRGPTNMPPLIINIGKNATLKYSSPTPGAGSTVGRDRIDQWEQSYRANWGNVNSQINLADSSAVFDMSELVDTTHCYFYKVDGVKGSQILLPSGSPSIYFGAASNGTGRRYDMRIDSDIIAGAIGSQALQKYGVGTLYLGGENTYTGNTTVQEGALFIYGKVAGSVVLATNRVTSFGGDSKGKPQDYWTIAGNLSNTRGYVSAGATGGAIGELRVKGNIIMGSSEAWTLVDIENLGNYDVIKAGGTIALDGHLQLSPVPNSTLHAGTYRIIEAEGGITGSFFDVSKPGLLTLDCEVQVFSQHVDVVMTQLPFTGVRGLSDVSGKVAPLLDSLIGNAGADGIIGTLNAATGIGQLDRAIAQLTPLADRYWFTNAVIGTGDLTQRLDERVVQPLDDARHRFGIFAGCSALDMDIPATDGAESWEGTMIRFLGGVDFHVANNLSATVFYARDETKSDLDPLGSEGKIKSNTYGLHVNWRAGKWDLKAMAFYGTDDYESTRSVALAGAGDWVRASSSGKRLGGALNVSYVFEDVIGGALSPYAGLQYVKWDADGYAETGATLPMSVDDQSATSLVGKAGIRFVYPFKLLKLSCRTVLNAGWQFEMGDKDRTVRASLNDNNYELDLTNDGNGYVLRAAFEIDFSKRLTLHLSAGKEDGLHDVDNVSGYAGIAFRF